MHRLTITFLCNLQMHTLENLSAGFTKVSKVCKTKCLLEEEKNSQISWIWENQLENTSASTSAGKTTEKDCINMIPLCLYNYSSGGGGGRRLPYSHRIKTIIKTS